MVKITYNEFLLKTYLSVVLLYVPFIHLYSMYFYLLNYLIKFSCLIKKRSITWHQEKKSATKYYCTKT